MKDLPLYDIIIFKIMISYFDLYFKNNVLLKYNIPHKLKRLTLRKVYISKPEIKHTNNKTVITVYVYNKTKLFFLKKIIKLVRVFIKYFYNIYYNKNYSKNLIEFLNKIDYSRKIRNLFLKRVRIGKKNLSRKKFLRKIKTKYFFNKFLENKVIKIRNRNLQQKENLFLNIISIKYKILFKSSSRVCSCSRPWPTAVAGMPTAASTWCCQSCSGSSRAWRPARSTLPTQSTAHR
jgi:hypothetical protein